MGKNTTSRIMNEFKTSNDSIISKHQTIPMKIDRECVISIKRDSKQIYSSILRSGFTLNESNGNLTIKDENNKPVLNSKLDGNSIILIDGKKLAKETRKHG